MRTSIDPEATAATEPALTVERTMTASAAALYRAWTDRFGDWFAEPDTVLMRAEVDVPYFFETLFEGQRHPHHGRFVELVPDELVTLTWTNAAVQGAETVVRVDLSPAEGGCHLTLRHGGFPDDETRDQTKDAWPQVLEHLDHVIRGE
ncbi:hypothetical protein N802_10405 [Knoellia sinensis KCTC 19936]|uniref:Activator of Hsp90 ATPase homologue 1/2-like C-terminal domain-containing protein n=1 Tax=Knoellia sinensis KCTC 19936 TaxID=1385520 RepID=A0A0A0J0V1_9MICO|nr:SRPBCC domain-containing protein [Knoellia sinensis]KGN29812.1 hypothetical protein N802_10405 [Knoellia sinensis KCTC 19936]